MSFHHINAVLKCSHFKGTTRNVLFFLANCASGGPGEDKKHLPFGWTRKSLPQIMAACNTRRQQTITRAINELVDVGVLKQHTQRAAAPLYFVNLDWLKEHEYTEKQLEGFVYTALRKARAASGSDASATREKRVSHPSDHDQPSGSGSESTDLGWPYSDPTPPIGNAAVSRKAANEDNATRLTNTTESGYPSQRKAANSIRSCSFSDRSLNTFASQTPADDSDNFVETPSVRPGEPGPVAPTSVVNPQIPVHSQQRSALSVPPAPAFDVEEMLQTHTWPTDPEDLCSNGEPSGPAQCLVCKVKAASVRRHGTRCVRIRTLEEVLLEQQVEAD